MLSCAVSATHRETDSCYCMGLSVRCVRKSTAVQLLAKNFAAMRRLGDPVLKPFLQACMPAPKTTPCSSWEYLLHLWHALGTGSMSLRKPCMILLGGCGSEQAENKGLVHTSVLSHSCTGAAMQPGHCAHFRALALPLRTLPSLLHCPRDKAEPLHA